MPVRRCTCLPAAVGGEDRPRGRHLVQARARVHRSADHRVRHGHPQGVVLPGYRAHAGRIQTGAVTIGRDVFIGEKSVLDINTAMGDKAQLGHASSLHSGGWVPAGERWHGSPAQPTAVDYLRVPPVRCGAFRRASAGFSLCWRCSSSPCHWPRAAWRWLLSRFPRSPHWCSPANTSVGTPEFYVDAAVISVVLFGGAVVLGWFFMMTVPRVLNLVLAPEKVTPCTDAALSDQPRHHPHDQLKFFTQLFGNSSL